MSSIRSKTPRSKTPRSKTQSKRRIGKSLTKKSGRRGLLSIIRQKIRTNPIDKIATYTKLTPQLVKLSVQFTTSVMHHSITSRIKSEYRNLMNSKSDMDFFHKLGLIVLDDRNPRMRKHQKKLQEIIKNSRRKSPKSPKSPSKSKSIRGGYGELVAYTIGETTGFNVAMFGTMFYIGLQSLMVGFTVTSVMETVKDPELPLYHLSDTTVGVSERVSEAMDIHEICKNEPKISILKTLEHILPANTETQTAVQMVNYFNCFQTQKEEKDFLNWFEANYGDVKKFKDEETKLKTSFENDIKNHLQESKALVPYKSEAKVGDASDIIQTEAEMGLVVYDTVRNELQRDGIFEINDEGEVRMMDRPKGLSQDDLVSHLDKQIGKLDNFIKKIDDGTIEKEVEDKMNVSKETDESSKTLASSLYNLYTENKDYVMKALAIATFSTNPISKALFEMKVSMIKARGEMNSMKLDLEKEKSSIEMNVDLFLAQLEHLYTTTNGIFSKIIHIGSSFTLLFGMRALKSYKVLFQGNRMVGFDVRDGNGPQDAIVGFNGRRAIEN